MYVSLHLDSIISNLVWIHLLIDFLHGSRILSSLEYHDFWFFLY